MVIKNGDLNVHNNSQDFQGTQGVVSLIVGKITDNRFDTCLKSRYTTVILTLCKTHTKMYGKKGKLVYL